MPVYRITGLQAAVNGLTCLKQFRLAVHGVDTVAACSASDGAVLRSDGNADWQGVALGYGLPTIYPNTFFSFVGSDRAGEGWSSGDEEGAGRGAICTKVHLFCPTEAGRNIYYHLYFAGNGSLVKGGSAADATIPNPKNSKGLAFKINDATTYGVLGWELEIDGNVTSPTWPSHMAGWAVRDPGNIDATLKWKQQFDATNQLPNINDFAEFKPYVTSALFYDIKWGQVLALPTDYPIEGSPPGQGEYITADCEAKFSGFYNGAAGYLKLPASVTLPDGSSGMQYWPL
jgi:hypothetical protein